MKKRIASVIFLLTCTLYGFLHFTRRQEQNEKEEWQLKKDYFNVDSWNFDPVIKYRKRNTTVYTRCDITPPETVNSRPPVFFFAETYNLAFCKVPKAGSTFVGTVVSALEHNGILGNMFHVNRELVHGRHEVTLFTLLNHKSHVLNILTSRNPYARLYSAYLDKYFVLGIWGKKMAEDQNKTEHFKMRDGFCGYSISFQEFLDYITDISFDGKRVDEHSAPVSSLCDPCHVRYDVICTSETLMEDTEHVLNVINITESKRESIKKMIRRKDLNDTIFAWVSSHLWYFRVYSGDCSDRYLHLEKLWTVLQCQGYIQTWRKFPLHVFQKVSVFRAETVTSAILQQVHAHPLTYPQMVSQRQRALTEAYSAIKPDTILKVQRMFAQDFMLFDYDTKPP